MWGVAGFAVKAQGLNHQSFLELLWVLERLPEAPKDPMTGLLGSFIANMYVHILVDYTHVCGLPTAFGGATAGRLYKLYRRRHIPNVIL